MYTKEAMMEYFKPGSGIPLDTLLEAFGSACNKTKRACFYITRNVSTNKWRIAFTAMDKHFVHQDLRQALNAAGEWLVANRVKQDDRYVIKLMWTR